MKGEIVEKLALVGLLLVSGGIACSSASGTDAVGAYPKTDSGPSDAAGHGGQDAGNDTGIGGAGGTGGSEGSDASDGSSSPDAPTDSPPDASLACPSGNGDYCGSASLGQTAGFLYTCSAGNYTQKSTCEGLGCQSNIGKSDTCKSAVDAGVDANAADTGTADAADTGAADTGPADTGLPDAAPDTQAPDATIDASPIVYGIPGQSCSGGLDCDGVDCCQTILVPGGSFPMGRSVSGTDAYAGGNFSEQPEHNATVDSYYLDTFEVTVGRFRKFVAAYNGTPPTVGTGDHHGIGFGWQSAWNTSLPVGQAAMIATLNCSSSYQTWTNAVGANENRAINCVNWFEAAAFCLWDGSRLPTEAEWEYASAGGADNRLYPWGAEDPNLDKTLANFTGSNKSPFINVGAHPKGKATWGHQDLAGGVWEWAMDWYAGGYYAGAGNSCNNCGNSQLSPSGRVVRGGGWGDTSTVLRAAYRFYDNDPSNQHSSGVGFRCSRSP